jgi:WD40 repeat protein
MATWLVPETKAAVITVGLLFSFTGTAVVFGLLLLLLLMQSHATHQKPANELERLDTKALLDFQADGNLKLRDSTHLWSMPVTAFSLGSCALSNDERLFASSGVTNIDIWALPSGKHLHRLNKTEFVVYGLAFSPDNHYLASGHNDRAIRIWDLKTGNFVCNLQGHTERVSCVTFGRDGKFLASGSFDGTIKLWDLTQGPFHEKKSSNVNGQNLKFGGVPCVRTLDVPKTNYFFNSEVNSLAISESGKTLASGGTGSEIYLWDLQNGRILNKLERGESSGNFYQSVAFRPDGKILASGSWDCSVSIWDVGTGNLIESLKNPDRVNRVIFSPDGRTLAAGGWGPIQLWDLSAIRPLIPNRSKQLTKEIRFLDGLPANQSALLVIAFLIMFLAAPLAICGFGLLRLPGEARRSGWQLKNWVFLTRHIPSEFGFLTRRPQSQSHKNLRIYGIFSCTIPPIFAAAPFMVLGFQYWPLPVFATLASAYFGTKLASLLRQKALKIAMTDGRIEEVKAPIVYLRAFKDDRELSSLDGPRTIEENIVMTLLCAEHRVVALGKPGEITAPAGAERFYVDDTEWQSVISEWLLRSHATLMIATDTDATEWELAEVFRTGSHSRLLILFLNITRASKLEELAERLAEKTLLDSNNKLNTKSVLMTFDRLSALEIPNLDWKQDWEDKVLFQPKTPLIGVAFEEDRSPILLAAKKRDRFAFEEAVKWHLNRVNNPLAVD